jgi:hypothetical protein
LAEIGKRDDKNAEPADICPVDASSDGACNLRDSIPLSVDSFPITGAVQSGVVEK